MFTAQETDQDRNSAIAGCQYNKRSTSMGRCEMRRHAASAGLAMALLALVPFASEAQVYKCKASGSTVYQAVPCANAPHAAPHIAAPAASSVSNPVAAAPDLHGSLASLRLALQAAAADERDLLMRYRLETDATRNKMIRAASDEAVHAQQAIAEYFAPLIRAAQVRQQQIREEIMRRCPVGAPWDTQGESCKQ